MILTYDDSSGAPGKTDAARDVVDVRFLELNPETRVVESITFESDDSAFAGTMTLITTMTPVQGGTKVTFTAEDVPIGINEGDHQKGMDSSLKNLAKLLD